MKIAINGFGRIGRAVFRILDREPDIEITAINDLFDPAALRYLLAYDTVMGGFGRELRYEDGCLVTKHNRTKLLCEKSPPALPWAALGIDAVVESTGVFRKKAQLEQHLAAGSGVERKRLADLGMEDNRFLRRAVVDDVPTVFVQ